MLPKQRNKGSKKNANTETPSTIFHKKQINQAELQTLLQLAYAGDKKAFKILKEQAELNNSNAQYLLGCMLYQGYGLLEDKSQGYYWIYKAAQGGNVDAQYYLGEMHIEMALECISKTAAQGHQAAQTQMLWLFGARNVGAIYRMKNKILQSQGKSEPLTNPQAQQPKPTEKASFKMHSPTLFKLNIPLPITRQPVFKNIQRVIANATLFFTTDNNRVVITISKNASTISNEHIFKMLLENLKVLSNNENAVTLPGKEKGRADTLTLKITDEPTLKRIVKILGDKLGLSDMPSLEDDEQTPYRVPSPTQSTSG